jgi:hypothetical protein
MDKAKSDDLALLADPAIEVVRLPFPKLGELRESAAGIVTVGDAEKALGEIRVSVALARPW